MIEITNNGVNYGKDVDKYYKKHKGTRVFKGLSNVSKILMYLFGAFFIFAVANVTLIYSFFRILVNYMSSSSGETNNYIVEGRN